jgi:RNA polymerase sigma-70 factor (ECF subfamily)
MSDADEALAAKARGGDRAAFEELVRRTSRLLFARLFLETGDAHRAEDLVQETWLRAYRSVARLSDPANLRPWLLTIAENVLADEARAESRQKRAAPPRAGPQALASQPAHLLSPEEEAARQELRGQVQAVLRSLPEEYRLPLTLHYLAGADYDTIETQLGLTNGSLRGLLHRGLKLLRARLGPALGIDAAEPESQSSARKSSPRRQRG